MPPIFRHVRPNVPAFTAGNGKPSYDMLSGKPVYQAVPIYEYEWLGYVDLTAFIAEAEEETGETYEGPAQISAAELNDHSYKYGDDVRAYGDMQIRNYSTGAGDALNGTAFGPDSYLITQRGQEAVDLYRYRIWTHFRVLWDATLSGWCWFAYTQTARFEIILGYDTHYPRYTATAQALFRQPLGTTAIRPGATGVTIPFSSCADPLFASAFPNASVRVTSHH